MADETELARLGNAVQQAEADWQEAKQAMTYAQRDTPQRYHQAVGAFQVRLEDYVRAVEAWIQALGEG